MSGPSVSQRPASGVSVSSPQLAVVPKVAVWGHSIAAGWANFTALDRITAKLARLLGATELNGGVASSGLLSDNTGKLHFSATGNWPTHTLNQGTPLRARAPYLSNLAIAYLMWGINDIGNWGPANAAFLAAWKSALLAEIYFSRLGSIVPATDASITYDTGTGGFTSSAQSGITMFFATVAGSNLSWTPPADFDGQSVCFFVYPSTGSGTQQTNATWTVTQGGTQLAQVTTNAATNPFTATNVLLPLCIRIPAGSFTPGVALKLTLTAVSATGFAFFGRIGIEANPAPLVIIGDVLRAPSYAAYAAYAYTPTDADINAVNAANAQVAATFTDGLVIQDGLDAVLNKTGNWLATSAGGVGVHPDERLCGQAAMSVFRLIKAQTAFLNALEYSDTP